MRLLTYATQTQKHAHIHTHMQTHTHINQPINHHLTSPSTHSEEPSKATHSSTHTHTHPPPTPVKESWGGGLTRGLEGLVLWQQTPSLPTGPARQIVCMYVRLCM